MSQAPQPAAFQGRRPRVMVLGLRQKANVGPEAERLLPFIQAHADVVGVDLDLAEPIHEPEFDLAVVLGGDGSILHAARQMGYRQRPVVGVNLGRLGFLADLSPSEFLERFARICQGEFRVISHLMFECQVLRNGQMRHELLGLNEVVIHFGSTYRLIDINLYVDAELVTTYSCDGLIVSTPVGSTAHSLSAGGPILRKDLQAFVIAAINPHTLTVRPVIDSADRVIELAVPRPEPGTTLVVDGQAIGPVEAGDRVRISRAPCTFGLVEVEGHGYYRTLREKLGWGGRLTR